MFSVGVSLKSNVFLALHFKSSLSPLREIKILFSRGDWGKR